MNEWVKQRRKGKRIEGGEQSRTVDISVMIHYFLFLVRDNRISVIGSHLECVGGFWFCVFFYSPSLSPSLSSPLLYLYKLPSKMPIYFSLCLIANIYGFITFFPLSDKKTTLMALFFVGYLIAVTSTIAFIVAILTPKWIYPNTLPVDATILASPSESNYRGIFYVDAGYPNMTCRDWILTYKDSVATCRPSTSSVIHHLHSKSLFHCF